MKALILAAGYATRLFPITKNIPKIENAIILVMPIEKILSCCTEILPPIYIDIPITKKRNNNIKY